ncbi:chromatin assembly factor 1 subunit A [Episyrphus balteatus]|uniref:chromatin assembly factor 1 subunit A n=1 Tax=Episyrphus balteatus TaxID=286459 RepID=UPI002486184C|nr:chromatin assembly factor 1 subunit A [Episyrphus balteatus]
MKTIESNSAKKANMRSARKSGKIATTPTTEKQKNEKDSSTGKKLVQARLPFKIIAGSLPIKPPDDAGASSGDVKEVPSKKRKLSFTEEPDNQKKIGKSDIKENLTTTDKIDADSSTVDVIVLDDDLSEEEETIPSDSKSPKTPVASGTISQKKKNKSTPSTAASGSGTSTTPKLQIKLPLSGKKKRKSKRASQSNAKVELSDASDVELVSDDQENPQKKLKLEEVQNDVGKKQTIASSESVADESIDVEEEHIKLSSSSKSPIKANKNEELSNKPTEPEPETPKTANLKKSPSPSKTIIKQAKKSPKQPKRTLKSKTPETIKLSPEKTEAIKEVSATSPEEKPSKATSSKKEDSDTLNEKSPKDIPLKDGDKKSPTKETRSTRRSIRITDSEKNKKETEEVVSSEPEIVSESAADTSLNKAIQQNKLLTPKQQKLMEQRRKAREEKELKLQQQKEERERKLQEQREERERKLQEEKLQKQKEREERELLRKKEREEKEEQKRREREEKEDQRRKEKEDKERKRLAEVEAKNEEKRKKDEAKEEERRKKDEDRRRKEIEKEEEENKKKKAAQAFTKFFVPKPAKPITDEDQESREDAESVDSLAFRPFQVKGAMRLAPLVRREFNDNSREKLDSFLKSTQTDKSALYIGELKSKAHTPLRGFKTVLKNNFEDDEDDVIIIASELENAAQTIDEPRTMPIQTYRAKYYYFRENRRPPFYGTWRKKSTVITSRRPFATDKAFFDYEVDSDDEWEEEEPGESLNGSEDEKDESEDEDYEVDNEWFVPHGHLSDEEMQNEDELGPDTSREAQKAKLKALQQEFAQEMKKKTEKIKPRLIGAIWEDENGNRPKLCPTIIWDSLCTRAMIFCEPPIMEAPEVPEPEPSTPPPEKLKRIKIKDDLMKDLVRLVHGNRHSRVFLIKEYLEHVSNTCETIKNGECLPPTKSQVKEKIDEISEWSVVDAVNKKNKNKKKLCWVVSADILDKHGLEKLGLRNEWSYKLQPKFDKDKNDQNEVNETEDEIPKSESSEQTKTDKTEKKNSKPPGIAKFTKVITKEEKKKQLTDQKCASPKATTKSSPKTSKTLPSPKVKEVQTSTTPTFKKPAPPATATAPNKTPVVKKRVALLMSVPPGQQFSAQSKNALISKFLQKNKTAPVAKLIEADESSKVPVHSVTKMDVDEVVVLD